MKHRQLTQWQWLFAMSVVVLLIAGCGGSGGGTAMMPDPAPMTNPVTVPMLPAGYNSNPAGSETVAAGASWTNGDVTYACPAGGAACMITVAANGTVTSRGGMATAMRSAASVARQMADEAAVVAATKAAGTKLAAIKAEASQSTDAGLGGDAGLGSDAADASDDTYSLEIERDRMGTKVTIADTGMAGMDDPKFATVMTLPEASGFAGTMNVRVNSDKDGTKVEEVAVVRTDIAGPKATAFAMVEGQALNARDLDDGVDADNDGDMTNDFTALTVDHTSSTVRALVKAAGFTYTGSGDVATVQFNSDNATTTNEDEAWEGPGTYNGAMGTYRCNGSTACSAVINKKGVLTNLSDGWIFTPDKGATSDVLDTDYLAYGFWLKRTTKDGATTYDEVEAFYMANCADPSDCDVAATNAAEIGNVVGTATYTGNSTGVYVKNVYEPSTSGEQKIASATSGHYSADVTLNANFGGGNIGVNNQFRIDGTVNNFALSGGEANDWAVKLESADFSGRTGATPDALGTPAGTTFVNVFDSTTIGDSTADKGNWNGGFFGATPETTATDDGSARVTPDHVLGEFNAYFTDGAVLGGFGADKQ